MNHEIRHLVMRLCDSGVKSRDIIRDAKQACREWEFKQALNTLRARDIGCKEIVEVDNCSNPRQS